MGGGLVTSCPRNPGGAVSSRCPVRRLAGAAIRFELDGAKPQDYVDLVRTVCRLDSGDNFNSRPEGQTKCGAARGRTLSLSIHRRAPFLLPFSTLVAELRSYAQNALLLSVARVRTQAIPSRRLARAVT